MPVDPPPTVAAVEVRAARLPDAPGEAAYSVVVVSAQQLQARERLDEALSAIPGVSLFRRTSSAGANPTTQGLALRAFAPSGAGRALVTLDGVPQTDPFGGWVIWGALPDQGLSAVRIVRGAGAGPYGAGALTGVVDLVSRVGAPGEADLDLSAGELGLLRATGAAELGMPAASVLVTGSHERDDGWIPVRAGRGPADARLTLDAWSAAARLRADWGPRVLALRIAGFGEARDSGLVGASSSVSGGQISTTIAQAPAPGALGWRVQGWADWSNLANTSVAVAAGRASTTPANDQFETPAHGYGFNAALRRSFAQADWELGADLRAAEGQTHERFRFVAPAFTRQRIAGGRTLVFGAYAEGDWRDGPWLVTGGGRLDRWQATGAIRRETDLATGLPTLDQSAPDRGGLEPTARLALRRDVGPLYLRAAAYSGFRPPTLNELHRPFRVGNDITEANPALTPEHLIGAELGAGGDGWNLTAFASRLSDAVTNVTVGFGPATFPTAGFVPAGGVLRQRQNVGEINALGVEAEASQRLGATLQTRQAIDWTVARVDGAALAPQLTGKRPAQSAALTLTAGANWQAAARLTLAADLRYESARWEDDLNTRRLGPAATLNLQARWRVTARLEAYIAVDNIADAAVPTGRTADNVVSYGPPRAARLGIRLHTGGSP